MTIRDARARTRAEQASRPISRGEAYYGPRLAELARRRAAGSAGIVALAVGVGMAIALVKILLALYRY